MREVEANSARAHRGGAQHKQLASESEDTDEEEDEQLGKIGMLRQCCETVTKPIGRALRICFGPASGRLRRGPLGDREATLRHLARVARLVYGTGFIDSENWGKYDPPLDGEGWQVVEQTLETKHSVSKIQAAMYKPSNGLADCAIVAYRGTVSRKGIIQDVSVAISGPSIRMAVREACSFYEMCRQRHGDVGTMYITGHSLGGLIAEAAASHADAPGASFNSPGPWHPCLRNLAGPHRPNYEIHLTSDDPISTVFPWPQNSAHIGDPIWHKGRNHRICQPYMCEISDMEGVRPNGLRVLTDMEYVDQRDNLLEIYAPPSDLDSSTGSE